MGILEQTCEAIYPQDGAARDEAQRRLAQLVPPPSAVGELAVNLAGMTRSNDGQLTKKAIVFLAADHGSDERLGGIGKRGKQCFLRGIADGTAAAVRLAESRGIDIWAVDMGMRESWGAVKKPVREVVKKTGPGTNDATRGAAMSMAIARKAVESGIEVARTIRDRDLIGVATVDCVSGRIAAACIASIMTGKSCDAPVLPAHQTDSDEDQRVKKVFQGILDRHPIDGRIGLEVLAAVGGYEIGGAAGLVLGAAMQRQPVVIDGPAALAGAMVACRIEPFVRDFIICADSCKDPVFEAMTSFIGCTSPVLGLREETGDGSASILAMEVVAGALGLLALPLS